VLAIKEEKLNLVELLKQHNDELGQGVSKGVVAALEAKLDVKIPNDFKEYLIKYNYAELYGDPIYGANSQLTGLDLYQNNKHQEHLKYGFLEVFSNSIDGSIYIRPDSGAVYTAGYQQPIALNFTEYVRMILANDS
jgi:hypothetical protein